MRCLHLADVGACTPFSFENIIVCERAIYFRCCLCFRYDELDTGVGNFDRVWFGWLPTTMSSLFNITFPDQHRPLIRTQASWWCGCYLISQAGLEAIQTNCARLHHGASPWLRISRRTCLELKALIVLLCHHRFRVVSMVVRVEILISPDTNLDRTMYNIRTYIYRNHSRIIILI